MLCAACNSQIQGEYVVSDVVVMGGRNQRPPAFCHECGRPYPWTERRIESARELANDFEELSTDDREKLKEAVVDVVVASPKTEVSAGRFKKIMGKVKSEGANAMKTILYDVLGEVAKRSIYGP